ncbi:MAG: ATP-binding protein [Anaerococcus sp.]
MEGHPSIFKISRNFILIGAINPCPSGNYGNPLEECTSSH